MGEEPRLARKLLAPLANIINTTPAKSLMYECIYTVTLALPHTKRPDGTDARAVPQVVRLCTDKLREFIKDMDQNLKYLGLVGLVQLMRSHPKVVAEHRNVVQTCLLDDDVTIRLQALQLITGMVTRRNLAEIVTRLVELVDTAEGQFRDELIEKVVFICSRNKFAYLQDFAWWVHLATKVATHTHYPQFANSLPVVALVSQVHYCASQAGVHQGHSPWPHAGTPASRRHHPRQGRAQVCC